MVGVWLDNFHIYCFLEIARVRNGYGSTPLQLPCILAVFLLKQTHLRMAQTFRIQADNVDARVFFASLVKGTEFSAAIHPEVTGSVTVNLTDVTLDDVLAVVRDMYGYEIIKKGSWQTFASS